MNRLRPALAAVALGFFLLTAWYGRPVSGLWNSPDETANAFWAERVASSESLAVRDVVIGLGNGAIHPRSMAVQGDALVPGSFSGLILLFGTLRLFTRLPFFLFTPLFTAVAGILFGLSIEKLFDRKTGFWSAILFFLHPAILYYAARGLFHNVLCVDLLIIAAACFLFRKRPIADALGGFAFGWAMLTRTSEAVWAMPAFLAFLPLLGKDRWKRLRWAVAGAAFPLFLLLQMNASLYGSPFRTAYVAAPSAAVVSQASPAPSATAPATALPFGFHPRLIARNAWAYGLKLFWWQSLLALGGFLLWLRAFRKATRAQKTYFVSALLTAAWLALLYGSWAVRDRLDPGRVTIGTSYVRYFLPAYVAMLPFGALAFVRLREKMKAPFTAIAAILVAALTIRATVFAGDESLRAVRATLAQNAAKKTILLGSVFPSDAVIMTERFDKVFAPDRLRIIPTADRAGFAAAAVAINYAPVYWYGLTPSADEAARLQGLAREQGLTLTGATSPIAGETAYHLTHE